MTRGLLLKNTKKGENNEGIERVLKFRKMKRLYGFFLILFSIGIISCGQRKADDCQDAYGIDFNEDRDKLGLPIIESDWVMHDCDTNFVYWSNRQNKVLSVEPTHLWKRVYLRNGELLKEEDVFHFESNINKAYRLVSQVYTEKKDSASFRLIIYHKNTFPPTFGREVTFFEADSILIAWNLKEFSFNDKK
jgi:hypothetical protein